MSEISRKQAQESIVGSPKQDDAGKDSAIAIGSAEAVEIDGRQKFFKMRGTWSCWIIAWITFLILFNAGLTVAVGLKGVDYANMQWFITAVTVETFLQIVGMGYVAVKFLFSRG